MASLSNPSVALTALTISATLILPGPTNSLLFLAGAKHGVLRSMSLVGVELLGYLLAIGCWYGLLGWAESVTPRSVLLLRACSACYVAYLAIKTWRDASASAQNNGGAVRQRELFCATLMNPKAYFFAAFVFPSTSAGSSALLQAYVLFSALLAPIGLGWVATGAALAAPRRSSSRHGLIQRVVAVVLLSFSLFMGVTLWPHLAAFADSGLDDTRVS